MNRLLRRSLICSCLFATLACRPATAPPTDYVRDYPPFARPGWIHAVIEIPAGTQDKWEVDPQTGMLAWEVVEGKPRVVQYLAYPGNYGMIPQTSLPKALGGDGDPLDILLLGPTLPRGSVVVVRPVGVLQLKDDGERDDKIVAVQATGPLSDVANLQTLNVRYPGATTIIETWFTHYKGPGRITSDGFADADTAIEIVQQAHRAFADR